MRHADPSHRLNTGKSRHRRLSAARGVAGFAALVLLLAAILKLWSILNPADATWLTTGAKLTNGGIAAFEIALAGMLLWNRWPRLAWLLAVCTFGVFAVVTAARAAAGEASCGWFGTLEIDPRLTLGLDLVILAGLLSTGPGRAATNSRWRIGPATPCPAVGGARISTLPVATLGRRA